MILLLTWVAFLLRVNRLGGQSLWRDEVDAIRFSSWTGLELLQGLFRTGHNGPLYFLLLRPWRSLTGDTEFALRFPSAVLGTVAIPLGYILARQLGFSRRTGLILGLLLATSPYLIWYGQEAKMYTLLLALIVAAVIAYLRALAGAGNRWWLGFVIITSLSFYTHILSPLILLVFGLVAGLYPEQWRQQWRAWLVSMLGLTLPYLPLAVWQVPLLLAGFESGHPYYPLREISSLLLQLYSSGLLRFAGVLPMILFAFLLLTGLFSQNRSSQRPAWRARWVVIFWCFLPPLAVYLISWRVQVFEDRYLIYTVPAFYLLIAWGLTSLRSQARWLAALGLGLILVINLSGVWRQQNQPIKADFRAAAAYLAAQPLPPATMMVQTPYLQHTLDYYYKNNYTFLEGIWTNGGQSPDSVADQMAALTAGLTELWLVVSEEDLWDERHLTRSWLDTHARLVDEAHFVRVSVYHYQFR